MKTIQIPLQEYQQLQEQLKLLKDKDLLQKLDKLIDLLYQEKYGLYMGDYTEDLTNNAWDDVLK